MRKKGKLSAWMYLIPVVFVLGVVIVIAWSLRSNMLRLRSESSLTGETANLNESRTGVQKIVFESQIPNYQIDQGSIDYEYLASLFKKLNIQPDKISFTFTEGTTSAEIKPDIVKVLLLPTSQWRSDLEQDPELINQRINDYVGSNGSVALRYMRPEKLDSRTVVLKVYEDMSQYSGGRQDINIILSYHALNELYFNLPVFKNEEGINPSNIVFDKIEGMNKPIFKAATKTGVRSVFNWLSQLVVKPAYAYCVGYVQFGSNTYGPGHCSGSYGNVTCSDNTPCTPLGATCVQGPVTGCSLSPNKNYCTWSSSFGMCMVTGSIGDCGQGTGCSWVNPPPPPPPPPPVGCGDAICNNGENCSTCWQDCGGCPPPPPPPGPVCGNGSCEFGEGCGSCPGDCGACSIACTGTLTPNPINLTGAGTQQVATVNLVGAQCNQITSVSFVSGNSLVATAVSPDGVAPFGTTITAVNTGTTIVSAIGNYTAGGGPATTSLGSTTVNVTNRCATPVVITPAANAFCAADNLQNAATIWQWDTVAGATQYDVSIIDNGTGATVATSGWGVAATFNCNAGVCSYAASLPTGTYHSSVQAQGTCSASLAGVSGNFTVNYCVYNMTGQVFNDPDGAATVNAVTGRCELNGATGQMPGAGSTVRLNTGDSVGVAGDGTFGPLQKTYGSYLASLQVGDPGTWFCSCPSSCNYSATVGPNLNNLTYFVASTREAWFQVLGGDVHADNYRVPIDPNSTAFFNPVPFSCTLSPTCKPYSITTDASNTPESVGILSYGTGVLDSWGASGTQTKNISEGGDKVVQSEFEGQKENYEFFFHLFDFPLNPIADFGGTMNAASLALPPVNTNNAYYNVGDLTLTGDLHITSGQKITVFVDGNFTQNAKTIVDPGGFLAFVVRGDITFPNTLVSVSNADPAVEGIYVANGTISMPSSGTTDEKLAVQGSLITWTGFTMPRTFGTSRNNAEPVITVTYRPDLVINTPKEFKYSKYTWRQVAP